MESTKKIKKEFNMPGTYVILTALIILMILLTYILPAGTFDFAEDGRTVIPGTYHLVESNPAGIMDFFNCFFQGMSKGSGTIFLIFMIGGAFKILEDTGTIKAAIAWLIKKTKGNYKIILPVIGLMMAALGSVGAGNNIALAFAPIMIMVCKKLKLDPIVAVAAMYIPSSSGTISSPIEPFNTLIGQEISGLPQMSGAGVRLFMWCVFVGVAILYIVRYANKIYKDPSKSIVGCYAPEEEVGDQDAALAEVAEKLTGRHVLCLIVLFSVFVVYAYGTIKFGWGISQLGACMMILAFAAGAIGGMSPDRMEKSFAAGAKTMTYSALLVGFANALSVIMTNANIIHTIINAISIPLATLPAALSAVGMFIVNVIINLFISSSSGHAYVIMPLMAPLADVVGVSRQVAVSAYCFGEAIGNPLFPTAALIMGICGIAGVKYDKWLKFCVPLTAILCVIGIIFLVVACIATIALGFFTPLMVIVQTIPACVTGGVSLVLYGFIASSGVKMLINEQVDFGKSRNIFIAAAILVAGIGGLSISFKVAGQAVTITSTAVAMILGIVLNLILKEKKEEAAEAIEEAPVEEVKE